MVIVVAVLALAADPVDELVARQRRRGVVAVTGSPPCRPGRSPTRRLPRPAARGVVTQDGIRVVDVDVDATPGRETAEGGQASAVTPDGRCAMSSARLSRDRGWAARRSTRTCRRRRRSRRLRTRRARRRDTAGGREVGETASSRCSHECRGRCCRRRSAASSSRWIGSCPARGSPGRGARSHCRHRARAPLRARARGVAT